MPSDGGAECGPSISELWITQLQGRGYESVLVVLSLLRASLDTARNRQIGISRHRRRSHQLSPTPDRRVGEESVATSEAGRGAVSFASRLRFSGAYLGRPERSCASRYSERRSVLHVCSGLSTLTLEYLGCNERPGKERPRSPSPTLLSGVALRSGSSGFRVVLPHQDESAATS